MEVTTNSETGETTSGRSPRFTTWLAFLVFATVTMVAAVAEVGITFICFSGAFRRFPRTIDYSENIRIESHLEEAVVVLGRFARMRLFKFFAKITTRQ
jgi:hypothetical protein